MGKKEAIKFLKKNNESIIKAWEDYRKQVGHPQNTQLDSVFEQMFKAWIISNKKAISILEKSPKRTKRVTTKQPEPQKSDSDIKWF